MFKSRAVIAHNYIDGLVIFLDEREGSIGLLLISAPDGDGCTRFQGFASFKVSKLNASNRNKAPDLKLRGYCADRKGMPGCCLSP